MTYITFIPCLFLSDAIKATYSQSMKVKYPVKYLNISNRKKSTKQIKIIKIYDCMSVSV